MIILIQKSRILKVLIVRMIITAMGAIKRDTLMLKRTGSKIIMCFPRRRKRKLKILCGMMSDRQERPLSRHLIRTLWTIVMWGRNLMILTLGRVLHKKKKNQNLSLLISNLILIVIQELLSKKNNKIQVVLLWQIF